MFSSSYIYMNSLHLMVMIVMFSLALILSLLKNYFHFLKTFFLPSWFIFSHFPCFLSRLCHVAEYAEGAKNPLKNSWKTNFFFASRVFSLSEYITALPPSEHIRNGNLSESSKRVKLKNNKFPCRHRLSLSEVVSLCMRFEKKNFVSLNKIILWCPKISL